MGEDGALVNIIEPVKKSKILQNQKWKYKQ